MMNMQSHRMVVGLQRALFYFSVAVAFTVILLPLALVVWLSFFSNPILALPPASYTLSWYRLLPEQTIFVSGFINSFVIALVATAGGLLVSIPAAFGITRGNFRGRELMMQFLTSPLTVPAIVIGSGLYVTFISIEIATSLPLVGNISGLAAGHVLLTIPWCIRLLVANLRSFDVTLEQASQSLGASPFHSIVLVTLPGIWPGVVAAALFSFVVSFSNLEVSLFLVSPGQTTLQIAVLQYLEWKIDPLIAAVSVVQTALIAIALLVTNRFVPLTRAV